MRSLVLVCVCGGWSTVPRLAMSVVMTAVAVSSVVVVVSPAAVATAQGQDETDEERAAAVAEDDPSQHDGGIAAPEPGDDGSPSGMTPEQLAEARSEFEAGRAAYEAGDFEAALGHFERAHYLTGSADLLYNIGAVNDRMRRDQEAVTAYQQYLAERPDSPDRSHVEARIRALEFSLQQRRAAAERATLEAAERQAALEAARSAEERAARAERRAEGPGAVPWVVAGTGVLAAGAGVALVVVASDAVNEVEQAPDASLWVGVEDAYDRAPKLGRLGAALIGVGVVTTITGIIWGLRSRVNEDEDDDADAASTHRRRADPGGARLDRVDLDLSVDASERPRGVLTVSGRF